MKTRDRVLQSAFVDDNTQSKTRMDAVEQWIGSIWLGFCFVVRLGFYVHSANVRAQKKREAMTHLDGLPHSNRIRQSISIAACRLDPHFPSLVSLVVLIRPSHPFQTTGTTRTTDATDDDRLRLPSLLHPMDTNTTGAGAGQGGQALPEDEGPVFISEEDILEVYDVDEGACV